MGQLDIAFKIWCSVDIFETKYNKSNILEHFFLVSASNLEIKLGAQLGNCDKTLPIYKCRLLMQT